MDKNSASEIIGRKSFFVGADTNMLPDAYLETFLAHGYETYRITADHVCSIQQKLELVATKYPGSLLFVYVDSPIEQISWEQCVRDLLQNHADAFVVILFSKRGVDSDRQQLEASYRAAGVQGPCVPLTYQRADNFAILERLLAENKANGRRKTIRALCTGSCEATFTLAQGRARASLLDISLSHFSCIFRDGEVSFPQNQLLTGVQLLINGNRFTTNVVFLMQRPTASGVLMVFMFLKDDKTPGLRDEEFFKLCPKIYTMVTGPVNEELIETYAQMNKLRNKKYTLQETVTLAMRNLAALKEGTAAQ